MSPRRLFRNLREDLGLRRGEHLADFLAEESPAETIGLYAGADRSRLYRDGQAVGIAREALKRMVADHDIRIMVATDAACEGLNLQTPGTPINVDLPWNPTRLEQRSGASNASASPAQASTC